MTRKTVDEGDVYSGRLSASEPNHGCRSHRKVKPLRRSLIAAMALAVVTAACSSSHTTRPASSSATTATTTKGTVPTTPRSVAGLTAEQLNAHLGVGVPKGWVPVDEGEARVFVPSDWYLEPQDACAEDRSAGGIVSVGKLPHANCNPANQYSIPAQAASLIPLFQHRSSRPSLTVRGYRVYNVGASTSGRFYEIPQLNVSIVLRGSLAGRVLGTLAPSARNVALAHNTVPTHWHAVSEDGVSLSIPPSWGVASPKFFCGDPVSVSELLLIKPDIGFAPCPGPSLMPVAALLDGVSLYLPPHNPNAPSPTGRPIATLQHDTTTITVYAETTDPNTLDLFVHNAGSKITHVLTLGLGRDGRVAGGVLASIRTDT